ncbi:MAG: alpha/beta fold hydrolase [Dehalococcoidia bacterium]
MTPERRTFMSQRLEMSYCVWGDERKPAVILVHGTRDHARSWDRTAAALVDRYAVYGLDLRGHGDSAWSVGGNYSFIDYALDLHALGEHLGRETYVLIGHSLGGGVALEYAGAAPERVAKIVTIEGLGGMGWYNGPRRPAHVRMRAWMEAMRKMEGREPRVYATIDEAVDRMVEANKHLSPELARHLTVEGVRKVAGGVTWKFDNYTHAGSPYEFNMEDARDLWNQIRCPMLILYGAESWGVRFGDKLDLSAFHSYEVHRVDTAGHWVHHDQFETFIGHVNRFLDRGTS